jgi:hypothetical protein
LRYILRIYLKSCSGRIRGMLAMTWQIRSQHFMAMGFEQRGEL